MTPRQLWFNFWAFFFGGLILLASLGIVIFVLARPGTQHPHLIAAFLAVQCLAAVLMIVGSFANFRWGIPRFWPMALAFVGCLLTGWLAPLGIWGIVIWLHYVAYRKGLRPQP